MGQPLLQAGTRVGIFRLVVAQPVVPQLVTLRGVHRRQELEGVERLATGVDLLEDEADGFMRCVGAQRDDRNTWYSAKFFSTSFLNCLKTSRISSSWPLPDQ